MAVTLPGPAIARPRTTPPQNATAVQASSPPVFCRRLAASCQIMMDVAMAYMLILMI
jgi:hypothetical protein